MVPALMLVALLAAAQVACASGEVHKCRGPAAQPVYQDRPCAPGEALRNFSDDPPTVSIIPFAREPAPPASASGRAPRTSKPVQRNTRVKRVFDAAERRHLKEGMTEGEVTARLGPPDQGGKGGRRSHWTYMPAPGDPQTVTVILFEEGRIAQVERRIMR